MADSNELNEALWGPKPTREQLLEVADWTDERTRTALVAVLEQCTLTDSAFLRFGFDTLELNDRVDKREIPAVNHGVGGRWIPTWLIVETEEGHGFDPKVVELWEIWKPYHGGTSFCENFAVFGRREFDGRTCLDVFQNDGDGGFQSVKNLLTQIRTPGWS